MSSASSADCTCAAVGVEVERRRRRALELQREGAVLRVRDGDRLDLVGAAARRRRRDRQRRDRLPERARDDVVQLLDRAGRVLDDLLTVSAILFAMFSRSLIDLPTSGGCVLRMLAEDAAVCAKDSI